MSFSARDVARWLGAPQELYRFTRQGVHWRYTSADHPVVVGAETFEPLAISRSSIAESMERRKREVTITLPVDAPVCSNWDPFAPEDPVTVTILAKHRGDSEVAVQWLGTVLQPRTNDSTCELVCEPGAGARSRGLQLRWQRGCPLVLYGQGRGMCNLNPAAFAASATLASVSSLVVSAASWAALPVGRLAGGYLQWTGAGGLVHRRSITSHEGAAVTLAYPAPGLAAGSAVTAYHGCAHDYADCSSKGNAANFGGCTKLPVKDLFAGNPIWW